MAMYNLAKSFEAIPAAEDVCLFSGLERYVRKSRQLGTEFIEFAKVLLILSAPTKTFLVRNSVNNGIFFTSTRWGSVDCTELDTHLPTRLFNPDLVFTSNSKMVSKFSTKT